MPDVNETELLNAILRFERAERRVDRLEALKALDPTNSRDIAVIHGRRAYISTPADRDGDGDRNIDTVDVVASFPE